MITGPQTQTVFLSQLLLQDSEKIAKGLINILKKNNIPVLWLEDTKDIWCRDYMPVWASKSNCVQFVFDPAYYRSKKYASRKTNPLPVTRSVRIYPMEVPVVLDGGNLVNSRNKAVVTERIFDDNPSYKEEDLVRVLKEILMVKELIVMPEMPGDVTGHVDSMVRFVDENTVLLTDLSHIIPAKQQRHYRLPLLSAGLSIITVPNALHENKKADDLTGDYVNFLEVGEVIVIPAYGTSLDKQVYDLYRKIFSDRKVVSLNISALSVLGGGLNSATWCAPLKRKSTGTFD